MREGCPRAPQGRDILTADRLGGYVDSGGLGGAGASEVQTSCGIFGSHISAQL